MKMLPVKSTETCWKTMPKKHTTTFRQSGQVSGWDSFFDSRLLYSLLQRQQKTILTPVTIDCSSSTSIDGMTNRSK
jgi:hypothetical protein